MASSLLLSLLTHIVVVLSSHLHARVFLETAQHLLVLDVIVRIIGRVTPTEHLYKLLLLILDLLNLLALACLEVFHHILANHIPVSVELGHACPSNRQDFICGYNDFTLPTLCLLLFMLGQDRLAVCSFGLEVQVSDLALIWLVVLKGC